jgi:hypothetical protein
VLKVCFTRLQLRSLIWLELLFFVRSPNVFNTCSIHLFISDIESSIVSSPRDIEIRRCKTVRVSFCWRSVCCISGRFRVPEFIFSITLISFHRYLGAVANTVSEIHFLFQITDSHVFRIWCHLNGDTIQWSFCKEGNKHNRRGRIHNGLCGLTKKVAQIQEAKTVAA